MDKLWAPWRMKYILNIDNSSLKDGCIFCNKPKENNDKENLILKRNNTCFIIMNLFPYNNGHLLIIPYKHTNSLTNLNNEEKLELIQTVTDTTEKLKKTLNPDGFNIGLNIGRTSGAGIDEHIHFHIVPRWNGDTNFMPVINDTKVISESLEDSYRRLYEAFNE